MCQAGAPTLAYTLAHADVDVHGLLFADTFPSIVVAAIEVASVIELSEASGRVAAGLFMTEG